jgi:hypothetical protein
LKILGECHFNNERAFGKLLQALFPGKAEELESVYVRRRLLQR